MAKTRKTKKTTTGKRVEIEVNLPLTANEKVRRGERALQMLDEKDGLEIERKQVADKYKARIKGLEVTAKKLLQEFQTSTELRTITAIERRNFTTNRVEYMFRGKIIKTRELTFADRQDELPLKNGKTLTPKIGTDKSCAATPGKKGQRQAIDPDIANTIRSETSRTTKHSAVDGTSGNAVAAQ